MVIQRSGSQLFNVDLRTFPSFFSSFRLKKPERLSSLHDDPEKSSKTRKKEYKIKLLMVIDAFKAEFTMQKKR
jgi:hypothetical protein